MEMPGIGVLNEKPLHASLKEWYSRPGDRFEVPVDGFVVDIVRGRQLLEIQTGGFSSLRSKLRRLLPEHRVRLIYPIALEKWIIKLPVDESEEPTRRRSPKKGRVEDLFREMVSFPDLFADPHFSVEALLTRQEEVRSFDGKRGWRRKGWIVEERRLIDVVRSRRFDRPSDWLELLPEVLGHLFTTADMSEAMSIRRDLAQKMAYCLRGAGVIDIAGKRGRWNLYRIPDRH